MLPALQSARAKGQSASCQNNLKQHGTALELYALTFDGIGLPQKTRYQRVYTGIADVGRRRFIELTQAVNRIMEFGNDITKSRRRQIRKVVLEFRERPRGEFGLRRIGDNVNGSVTPEKLVESPGVFGNLGEPQTDMYFSIMPFLSIAQALQQAKVLSDHDIRIVFFGRVLRIRFAVCLVESAKSFK